MTVDELKRLLIDVPSEREVCIGISKGGNNSFGTFEDKGAIFYLTEIKDFYLIHDDGEKSSACFTV